MYRFDVTNFAALVNIDNAVVILSCLNIPLRFLIQSEPSLTSCCRIHLILEDLIV